MSAAEAARHLGETQANVSYHLRQLASIGLVQVVEEVNINGGRAKRYRHVSESGEVLGAEGLVEHTALMNSMAEALRGRARAYLPNTSHAFTDAEVRVSSASWDRIQQAAREFGELVHDAALPIDDDRGQVISATVAVFRLVNEAPSGSP